MAAVVDGGHAAWLRVAVEDLVGGPTAHEVAVVAPPAVVGDEPGVGLGLELADRGEATAMERRAPAFLEDGAMEALAHGVVVGRAGGIRTWLRPLAARAARNALAMYSGPLSVSTARTVTPRRR